MVLVDYIKAKSELRFVREYRALVKKLREVQGDLKEYKRFRECVVKRVLRVRRIAYRLGVPVKIIVRPPDYESDVQLDLFFDVLVPDIRHFNRFYRFILDAIDQTIGECEANVESQFMRLVNPVCWIKDVVKFIIRIPFLVIDASGFDVRKLEDHVLSKLVMLIWILVLICILIYLGAGKEQIREFLMRQTNLLK